MKSVKLTDDEFMFLKKIVEDTLAKFQKEESTVLDNITPSFMEGEVKYEEFLKNLLMKF